MHKQILKEILKYLLEIVIVFGSVYGSFRLESRRSTDFERQQLIGKLNTLYKEISMDTLKFQDMSADIMKECDN